jgi:hypothetical protein
MDDFVLSTRFTSPAQRDVIVGGWDTVPDISHFASEVVVTTDNIAGR